MSSRIWFLLLLLMALLLVLFTMFLNTQEPEAFTAQTLPKETPAATEPDKKSLDGSGDAQTDAMIHVTLLLQEKVRDFVTQHSAPLGHGLNSSLRGVIIDHAGTPIPNAELNFVVGLNQGMHATSDEAGHYEFPKLYPGLHFLHIKTDMGTILREIRLRTSSAEEKDFRLGVQATVAGKVVEQAGNPIEGAEIEIDGQKTKSGVDGVFYLAGIFPGDALIYVRAPNFAYYRQNLQIEAGKYYEPDSLQMVLQKGGTLQGGVYPVGGTEPVLLYLLPKPSSGIGDRSIPFEKFFAIEVASGGSFSIENVPLSKSMALYAFHAQSKATPNNKPVFLRTATQNLVSIEFRFTSQRPVQGTVLSGVDGKPLSKAKVQLLAQNAHATSSQIIHLTGPVSGMFPLPLLPPCRKEVLTDQEGKFFLESGDGSSATEQYQLFVDAPGYFPYAAQIKGKKLDPLQIMLYPVDAVLEDATLKIHFAAKRAYTVALEVNHNRKPWQQIAADEWFQVNGLTAGVYSLEIRRDQEVLFREENLAIAGEKVVELGE